MTELDELEIGISRLKKTSNEQKKIIEELKKERSFLIRKNNEIEDNIKNIQGQIKPTKSEVNELKKELNEVVVLIEDIMKKDSKFQSMLTEQKSNLFLLRSRFEKDMDKALDDIEERIKENKRIELTRFNDLKSKMEKLAGTEDRLKDQDKSQKMIIEKLIEDISKIQQTVTSLTSQRFDVELENLSKRLSSETKSLMKQITESSEIIVGLKDKLQYFEPVIKNLSNSMEKIQLNEARREENFNNMVGRLQELRIRTEDSIKSLNEKITQISKIEGNLERKLRKDNEAIFKRLGSSYDGLDERLQISENSISKLGESIKGLGKRLEDQLMLLNETGKRLTVLESDVIEQSKSQESQFKGFNNTVKIIDDIEKRLLNSEKVISQLGGLVERIDDLEKESKRTDDFDKRLLISENLISQIEKSIKETKKFEESYKKDIESRFQKALKDRTRELEANLIGESESLTKDIKSLAKDLSSERERVGILEQERELIRKDILGVKEHLESTFHHTLQGRAKELEADIITRSNSLDEDLKSLAKEVSSGKERIVVLEEELKNQIKEHQSQTKNLNSLAGTLDGFEERVLNSQNFMQRMDDSVRDIESRFQQALKDRTRELEASLIGKSENLVKDFRTLDKEVSLGKERITVLEQELKNQLNERKSKNKELTDLSENLLRLEERISDYEKLISHTSEAVTEMRTRIMDEEGIAKRFEEQSKVIDRVTNAGNRLTMLEERLKAQSSDHDLRFNELIGVIKDLELGETKRIDEFNSFIERFQELKRKTEHNLTLFNQNVKKLSDIKSEIKAEVNKDIENRIKEFGLDSEDTKNKIIATEELLVQLRDTLEELGLNMDSWAGKTKSLEVGLKNLTGELTSEKEIRTSLEQRLKSQEKGRELMFANVSNLMRDMELGEANRIREYNNFIAKFREMRTNANEVIKSLKKEKEAFNKMSAGFAAKEVKINEKINSFVEDTNSRIKTNEEMYDSEMDAFKNKLDEVIRELIAFKEMQKESLGAARETTVQDAGIRKKEPTVLREPKEPTPIKVEESEPEKPEILAKIKKSEKDLL
ncbi:MAG: hypothetical protein JSW41_03295 [Candidatus Aenigmatarchaeota archaeon]|nr:MAG: hypothetical protein JSW41_03295 [Candidatus Aenigmarchaeota archaeon]